MALTQDQQFFYDNAGYSYPVGEEENKEQHRVSHAVSLAAGEAWARQEGYAFDWTIDPECTSYDQGISTRADSYRLWQVSAYGPDGEFVAGVGAVDFGRGGSPWGDPYRRVAEAEMAVDLQATVG